MSFKKFKYSELYYYQKPVKKIRFKFHAGIICKNKYKLWYI